MDISGNDFNEAQNKKIAFNFVKFLISQIDTSNITNMKDMFSECTSIILLPDFSNWNLSNVTRIDGLFACFDSLLSLPDISKLDTSNVENMKELFYQSSLLTSLPDI